MSDKTDDGNTGQPMNLKDHQAAFVSAGRSALIQGMFFTVGLAFTVLAASLETFKRVAGCSGGVALVFEMLGWAALLFSSAAGMGWIHDTPTAYFQQAGALATPQPGAIKHAASYKWWHRLLLLAGLFCIAISRAVSAIFG